MSKRVLQIVLLVLVCSIVSYDYYAGAKGYEQTITAHIREASHGQPIIPASIGLFFGYVLGRSVTKGKP